MEVLSPTTRRVDVTLKRSRYEAAGCSSYWVVDPDEPALIAWDLDDGAYVQMAHVSGADSWRAAHPYAVRIRPRDLVSTLRPS